MSTRFEEDSSVDLRSLGWGNTPVIRSHRRAPRYSSKRITGLALVVTITATGLTTSVATSTSLHTPPAVVTLAAAPLLDLPTIILPQQAEIEAERTYHASVPSRSYGRSAPAVISKVEVIIQFALAQQGDPYVWAKAGPNAYDCSGLVLRAYSQVGINLPHYTGTMINKGSKVSRANLQRGDIIFPTSGHVGIYLGNGQMIHASSGKGKVVVAPMYSFYAARRLV